MEADAMTEKRPVEGPSDDKRALPDGRLSTGCEPIQRRRPSASRMPSGRRTQKQLIGQAAENIAADFLRAKGLEILERNYLRRLGELDIVARDGEVLVIAEVRTRSSDRYGGAAASVDARKQQRIIRAASQLLQQRRDLARLRVRFDVITVSEMDREPPRVEWLQHAFLT
jgi:putative endonuclease